MLLASQTIQEGRIARREGKPITATPLFPCNEKFADVMEAGKVVRVRVDLDWEGLWLAGWKIEERFGGA